MILIISTLNRYDFSLGLFDDQLIMETFDTQDQSQDLLPQIDLFLKNNKITLQDLTAIFVDLGPGSYTGIRVGVTIANTLAWSLNIPVYGFKTEELKKSLVETKISDNFTHPVLPLYQDKKMI